MARKPIAVFLRHAAAMHLLLMMQNQDKSHPNVDYVFNNPLPPKVADFPAATRHQQYDLLQDMFPVVNADVYKAFHKLLREGRNVPGPVPVVVDRNTVRNTTGDNANILQALGDVAEFPLWSGDFPHPCRWIMREVVAELLAVDV